jgi:phosphomannomutase
MATGHKFNSTVLREYDIRGIVGDTLSEADAHAIGRAFGTIVGADGGGRVCVGYDGRLSSTAFEAAVVEGLTAVGIDALRIGLGPSPMLYFAVHTLGADGGIMVTGSHNPPDYNGFKMMIGTRSFHGADIQALGALAASGGYGSGKGRATEVAVAEDYVAHLAADFDGGRDLNVVWDAGNGAAGSVTEALCDRLPGRHRVLFAEVDGRFPNHHPDPTLPETLADLRRAVKEEGAEAGIAFDGDGDRIGVIDGQGRILWGDQIMMLLARDVLATQPGATIIADVKASQALFDEIARLGGQPLMWRTGHSLIKTKMAEIGAPLAGEMSGHIFFADRYFGFDDALYAALRLLGLVSRSAATLADLHDELPRMVNTPELRFPCPEARKFAVVEEVEARLREAGADFSDIDGVRVRSQDGWWLLRASNTQSVLVARCESGSEAGLDRLKDALATALRASGIEPPDA